jgi:hypothetical protein
MARDMPANFEQGPGAPERRGHESGRLTDSTGLAGWCRRKLQGARFGGNTDLPDRRSRLSFNQAAELKEDN